MSAGRFRHGERAETGARRPFVERLNDAGSEVMMGTKVPRFGDLDLCKSQPLPGFG
jgi:hypothetical protein